MAGRLASELASTVGDSRRRALPVAAHASVTRRLLDSAPVLMSIGPAS